MDDQKLEGRGFFCLQRKVVFKISKWNRFEICEKTKILSYFKIKHDTNNIIVVDQFTIAANEPTQVYLEII